MDKKNISRLLRTGYDPDAMMIAKEFEPLDFDDDSKKKKFNILWDKPFSKSKYAQHKLNNGSARRGHLKQKEKQKHNRNFGLIRGTRTKVRQVFQYTRQTPDGHEEQCFKVRFEAIKQTPRNINRGRHLSISTF